MGQQGKAFSREGCDWLKSRVDLGIDTSAAKKEGGVDGVAEGMAAVDISDGSSAAATPASNPSPPPDSLPPLELVSLDLQPSWEPYVKALQTPRSLASYSFHQWDIKAEVDAVTASGLECLDLCIISNVLVYCTDERTADVLSDLLINRKVCAASFSNQNERERSRTLCPFVSPS